MQDEIKAHTLSIGSEEGNVCMSVAVSHALEIEGRSITK